MMHIINSIIKQIVLDRRKSCGWVIEFNVCFEKQIFMRTGNQSLTHNVMSLLKFIYFEHNTKEKYLYFI
jgi:hypothetical protein